MSDAVGSSLLVIALNSFAGLAGKLPLEGLDWQLTLMFVGAGIVGLLLGTHWSTIWSTQRLRLLFAGMVLVMAVVLLAINVPLLVMGGLA
jgi:hypothetical protein